MSLAVAVAGASWIVAGVAASLSEPDVWTHHRTGRFDPQTAAIIIALGWLNLLARPIACFGMRAVERDSAAQAIPHPEVQP